MPTLPPIQLHSQRPNDLGSDGMKTWMAILSQHAPMRKELIYELFDLGVEKLGIASDRLPDLDSINMRLKKSTGFQGAFVDGFEEVPSFYVMLAHRYFPIGNFIRSSLDINYTPAPDIVHDLYGHLPFLADQAYADFCQKFGELGCEFLNEPEKLKQFERFFWFTIEFGLIRTKQGLKVFGAGIASSLGECMYALSGKPEIIPFDVDLIRHQEFRIDIMQEKLFVIENVKQLYDSLPELYARVKAGN